MAILDIGLNVAQVKTLLFEMQAMLDTYKAEGE